MQHHEELHAGEASSGQPDENRPIWNLIWRAGVPQKMKILAWKAVTGALATHKCMQYRHLRTSATCPLCGLEEDSSFHALVACTEAMALWNGMCSRWPLPGTSTCWTMEKSG